MLTALHAGPAGLAPVIAPTAGSCATSDPRGDLAAAADEALIQTEASN
jgi:hypothetical protein